MYLEISVPSVWEIIFNGSVSIVLGSGIVLVCLTLIEKNLFREGKVKQSQIVGAVTQITSITSVAGGMVYVLNKAVGAFL